MMRIAAAALIAGLFVSEAVAQRVTPPVKRVEKLDDPGPYTRDSIPSGPGHRDPSTRPPALQRESRPAIMLTGYWPPTNEMIRHFSTDPALNPGGWQGADWEGRGYDIYSYFPTFVPPNCGNCGKGSGDLEVDYQDTSGDFWPLADNIDPIAMITFSRGFWDDSWEVEMNQYNRTSWIDDYVAPRQPTPVPPETDEPGGLLRLSQLPVQDIVDAVNNAPNLTMNAFICYSGDGGGFLSEFAAYHGVWYFDEHRSPTYPDWCASAGHVHVGNLNSWPDCTIAAEITLREVIQFVDAKVANTICQPDLGFGGPGTATQVVCGEPLATGNTADLLLSSAPPSQPVFLLAGFSQNPSPWKGGTLVPLPPLIFQTLFTDAGGELLLEGIPGGGGPTTVYTQFVYPDAGQVQGWGFSNVVGIDFLP